MRLFPILTSIAVALALIFFIVLKKPDTENTDTADAGQVSEVADDSDKAVSVVVLASVSEEVQNGIILRGRTEAARRIDVKAQTAGLVISEPLRKGTLVEAGQLLCSLDPGTRPAQLTEATARLREAEVNQQNAIDLAGKGFAAETTVVAREAALATAKANLLRIEEDISRLEIRAPFAGVLESDTAEIGSLIQSGSLCATVIALDTIKLVGFATEQDIGKIQINAPAGARLVSGKQVLGKVTFISFSSDPVTRTFRIEVTVDNPGMKIRDGETAEIGISLPGEKAHLLPQAALTLNGEGTLGVRIAENGVARFMPVEILRDTTDGILLGGLPDEIEVIVVGQEFVIDGSLIKTSPLEATK